MNRKNLPDTKKYPHARIQGKPNRLWKTNSSQSIPDSLQEKCENLHLKEEINRDNTNFNQKELPGRSTSQTKQHVRNNYNRSRSTTNYKQAGTLYSDKKDEKYRDRTKQCKTSSGAVNRMSRTDKVNRKKDDQEINSAHGGRIVKKNIFGYKRLSNLFSINPETVLILLVNKDEGFVELLNQQNLSSDIIVLIARVLSYACESTFSQTKIALLITTCNLYINHLIKYIMFLPLQTVNEKFLNKDFWNNPNQFFISIVNICVEIIRLMPNTAYERLPKVVDGLQIVIDSLQKKGMAFDHDVLDKINNLSERLIVLTAEHEEKQRHSSENHGELEYNPPDSFRHIKAFPTLEDIKSNDKVFLKPNIIDGRYLNPEHYLDLQFRLLKEDFIAPLRSGIQEYYSKIARGEKKIRTIDNIRIYQKVRFVAATCVSNELCVLFDFGTGCNKNFLLKLENSKRLIFGSLLLFTFDNFKTVFFGTVVCRDGKFLKKGQIAVKLQSNVSFKTLHDKIFIMAESEIYFEPYFQVLSALQSMEANNFPMQRYIVDVQLDGKPPKYIRKNPIIKINTGNQCYRLNVLGDNWPTSNELKIDESQYEALKAALTHEFCVIQGPPGTGKTFLGLYIAKILLNNNSHWYSQHNLASTLTEHINEENNPLSTEPVLDDVERNINTPILIVCYTNHALDQFLEGILLVTKKIVRVGGRSKNEALNNYNLKKKRYHRRFKISNSLIQNLRIEMDDLRIKILGLENTLAELNSGKIVFDFEEVFKTRMNFLERQEWILGGIEHFNQEKRVLNATRELNSEIEDTENDIIDSEEEYCEDDFADRMQFDDDFVDVLLSKYGSKSFLLWSTIKIEANLENLKKSVIEKENSENEIDEAQIEQTNHIIEKLNKTLNYLNYRLQQGPEAFLEKPVNINRTDLYLLNSNDRWNLYWNWFKQYKENIISELDVLEEQYRTVLHQFEEVQQVEDISVLRECLVVGMTTTGAAKYRSVLQALKSPIVIVEEAAEVSESHIVVSLTLNCEHLILIGDHKQLRPSTATYRLARHFGLDISLFERMVHNGIHCSSLCVQHRMKPEIALLVAPTIYSNLQNHPCVDKYPSVIGIQKSLYFVAHSELETQTSDSKSKQNSHEADFVLYLCRHLILQGYKPEEITILTTYNGQMFSLRKKRQSMALLHKVQVTVVDNFQGEENKIILLSLVRSNLEEKVGFLSIENRVCVALSRAKHGLYIIGNMDMLKKKSNIWMKIYNTLKQQDSVGSHLTLQCKIHCMEFTQVSKGKDFQLCPEGGCSKLCGIILECGHECSSVCHVTDREHLLYKCQEPCQKFCERNHPCKAVCFLTPCPNCTTPIEYLLTCGHHVTLECYVDPNKYKCSVSVQVKLLLCGHEVNKLCWLDESSVCCPEPCIKRLPCGHQCTKTCHVADDPDHIQFQCEKDCARYNAGCTKSHLCKKRCYEECSPCKVPTLKKHAECDHRKRVFCSADVDAERCEKPCKRMLSCGHPCKKKCYENCDQAHCKLKVIKTAICGHELLTDCNQNPDRKKCKGRCPLIISCGHKCNQSCKNCANGCSGLKCQELVDHSFKSACGHTFKIPCYKKNLSFTSESYELLYCCTEPCMTELDCGHQCGGTCGLCFQGALHIPCKEQCNYPLICGHKCEVSCRQNCPPCSKKCSYKCHHSECPLKCGEPCRSCMEPCLRSCKHGKCSRKCSDICNKKPCNYPCSEKLACGHDCIGFCGEPCPPKCRVCDMEEITTIIFGPEDEPDARFVLLEDCGHVIVSTALETYLNMKPDSDTEINLHTCPMCKTPINKTQRYSDLIKVMYKDIINVKKLMFGIPADIEQRKEQAFKQVVRLKTKACFLNVPKFLGVLDNLSKLLDAVEGYRLSLNKFELNVFEVQIEVIEQIGQILEKVLSCCNVIPECLVDRLKYVATFLLLKRSKISKQETKDLDQELERLHILSKLCIIKSSKIYITNSVPLVKTLYETALKMLTRPKPLDGKALAASKELIKSLQKALKENIVTDEERQQVVMAMKSEIRQGAWFKCSKGHYYAIGECGGAMVTSKCVDCGEIVGGASHSLVSSSQHAREMDNSQYAAWSQLANMNNYVFE